MKRFHDPKFHINTYNDKYIGKFLFDIFEGSNLKFILFNML